MSGSTASRRTRLIHRHGLALTALLWLPLAQAQQASQPLPPRAEWKATSSSTANPAMAPAMGIDGNPRTYWGGPFSAGHWYRWIWAAAARWVACSSSGKAASPPIT